MACVVHLAPLGIVRLPAYRQWMASFAISAQHVLVAESITSRAPVMRKSSILQARASGYCRDGRAARPHLRPHPHRTRGCMQHELESLRCTKPVLSQAKLNLVDAMLFPLHDSAADVPSEELPANAVVGTNMLRYHLRPLAKKGIDSGRRRALGWAAGIAMGEQMRDFCWLHRRTTSSPNHCACCAHSGHSLSSCVLAVDCPEHVDVGEVQAEVKREQPEVLEALAAAATPHHDTDVPGCVALGSRSEFEVTFLGTGAAVPSKYRNVTGLYVNLFDRGGLLMDCGKRLARCQHGGHVRAHGPVVPGIPPAGEGSYGQLKRRFGSVAGDDLLCSLRCIWISHIHADHHVGLPALLAARTRLLGPDCPPLLVLGPRPLRRALQGYAQLEPMRFYFVEASATAFAATAGAPEPPPLAPEERAAVDGVMAQLGLTRFESVLVAHCAHAYGLVLERGGQAHGGQPWKLVFSGDTRPCAQLVEAAKGATLLIHEARAGARCLCPSLLHRCLAAGLPAQCLLA